MNTTISLKQRPELVYRTNVVNKVRRATAKAPSNAEPVDLLGAKPNKEVAYLSNMAKALSSGEAAQIDAQFLTYDVKGAKFNAVLV